MISFDKLPAAALRVLCGAALAVSLCAAPAFAEPTPSDSGGTSEPAALRHPTREAGTPQRSTGVTRAR